jgi:hypothetical protein
MANCIVDGKITTMAGAPVAGAVVAFRPDAPANDVNFVDDGAVSRDEIVRITDENGEFSVTLLQGAAIAVRVDEINLFRQVTVPAQSQATLEELLDANL